jgi:hypothetical protein
MDKTVFRGIVRGKNIELEEAPPLPNGEPVTVQIHPQRAPGDGIRASAGAWADAGEGFDKWLEEVYRARHFGRSTDSL